MHKTVKILLLTVLIFAPGSAFAADDMLIVPGERLGFINRNTNEEEITKHLSASQYKRAIVPVGEGFGRRGLILYPGTDKEVAIVWKSDKQQISTADAGVAMSAPVLFKNPDFITITKPHSKWHTSEGISVGTSLKDLRRLNGMDFVFAGFGWEYAGRIYSWHDGHISTCLGVDVGFADAVPADMPTGDDEVDSDSDIVKKYEKKMSVKTIFVAFPEIYGGRCN